MNDQTKVLELEAEIRAYLRVIGNATDTILRRSAERDEAYADREELREQISWATSRCNDAMGEGFSGTYDSAVAAVCDTLKIYREILERIAGGNGATFDELVEQYRSKP